MLIFAPHSGFWDSLQYCPVLHAMFKKLIIPGKFNLWRKEGKLYHYDKKRSWDRASLTYSSITNKMQRYTMVFFFIFFLQRYEPFSLALASRIIDAHSSLSNTFILHRFTSSFLKSSSTSFIHLSLGRPLPLLPSNFPSKIFFTALISFILIIFLQRSSLQTCSRSF